jgi:hypothetical protein
MSEDTLNKSIPFSDYVPIITEKQQSNDDAFYTSLLPNTKTDDPIELYNYIKEEQREQGKSLLVEEARFQWELEQEDSSKRILENIITNPEISPEEKKANLQNFMSNTYISKDIKDKAIQDLSNSYILENNLDNDLASIDVINMEIDKLKVEQNTEKLVDNIKANGNNSNDINEEDLADALLVVAKQIGQSENPNIEFEPITATAMWAYDMLIGKSPQFIKNTLEIIQRKTGGVSLPQMVVPKVLALLFPSNTLLKQIQTVVPEDKTWTEVQKEVYSEDTFVNATEETVREALTELGYNPEVLENSIPGLVFNQGFGYAIDKISNFLSPEDPAKVAIPLEVGVSILPFVILRNRKGKDVETIEESGFRDVHVKATKEQMEAVREANRKSAEQYQKQNITPSPDNKVKVNSPIVTVSKTNPKAGSKLVETIIEDVTGEIGKASGLDANKLAIYLTDPNANIIKNPKFGFRNDISSVSAMNAVTQRSRALLIDNPNLADSALVDQYAEKTAFTLNGIIPKLPMIVANSQTITSYIRTPAGMLQSVVFQKSPSEYYNKAEALEAYTQVEKSILDNFAGEEKAIKPTELLIQEVTPDNNVLRQFTPEQFLGADPASFLNTNSYYIRWTPDIPMYDYTNNVMGALPSERFPTNKVTDKLQRFIYDTEASASKTGGMQRFFVYGRHNSKLEKKVYQDEVTKQSFFEQQKRILVRTFKKDLTVKQQNQLDVLLTYQDKNGLAQLSQAQIVDALGTAPTVASMDKLQVALTTFRIYDNAVLAADNVTYANNLLETGYDKSFIVPRGKDVVLNNNMPPEVMPVKTEFDIAELDAFDSVFTETGIVLESTAWDYVNSKPIYFELGERGVRTHFTKLDGMPAQQVYRLKRNKVDENGDIYQYGVFGTFKPQPLPNQLIPARPGHVPRKHTESTMVIRIPLEQKINGRTIKTSIKNQFKELGNTRILDLTGKLLTKKQQAKRAEVMGILRQFGVTVAMVDSPRAAYAWSRENLTSSDNKSMYIIDKAAELQMNEIADFRIREQQAVMGIRLRNEQIDYTVKSDPLETALENARAADTAFSNIGLLQLKKEWVNTYMPMKGKVFTFEAIADKTGMIESDIVVPDFPLDISTITPTNVQYGEITRQAKADWWLITNKERSSMAVDSKYSAHAIRKLANLVGNITENTRFSGIAKTAREVQKNPDAVVGSPLTAVTTLQLLVNFPKQFFLQGAAFLANLSAVSKGGSLNPIGGPLSYEFLQNFVTVLALAHRYGKMTSDFKKSGKDIMRVNDAFFQDHLPNSLNDKSIMKYSPKQLEMLVQGIKEFSISLVGDHIYTQGILINRPPHLGESPFTPGALGKATVKGLTDIGFGAGELLQRFGQVVAALENWKNQNPGKSWENRKVISQIMWDAYRLSGSMTKATNLAWQNSLSLRTLAQFKSFMAKITEAAINPNATPFDFATRLKALAWNTVYFGATIAGIGVVINKVLESMDSPTAWWLARTHEKLNLAYLVGNFVGDTIFPDDRASMSKFGDLYSIYGDDFSFLGPYATMVELIIGIYNEDIDYNNAGAALSWFKRTINVGDEILDIWVRNPEAYKDGNVTKSMHSLATLFPPTKAYMQFVKEKQNDFEAATKTGHELGYTQTESEAWFKAFWGVQTAKNEYLWEVQTSDTNRRKSLIEHARRYMEIINRDTPSGVPTYMDVAKGLSDYIVVLNGVGFIANSNEHNEFISEVFGMMGRQQTPIAQNFIKKYYQRIFTGQLMTTKEIISARKIIELNYDEGSEEYKVANDFLNSMKALDTARSLGTDKVEQLKNKNNTLFNNKE